MKSQLVTLMTILLFSSECLATPYSNHIVFSGHVTAEEEASNQRGGDYKIGGDQFDIGDQFTGFIHYSFSGNTQPVSYTTGVYDTYTDGFIVSWGLFFDSIMFSSDYTFMQLNDGQTSDHLTIGAPVPVTDGGSQLIVDDAWITFHDPTGLSINDQYEIPKSLECFTGGTIYLAPWGESFGTYSTVGLDGIIDNIMVVSTPVPEPTTILLFATGLAGLAGVGRRRRI